MAWVNKQDMIRLLDSLKQITLDAYDGKIISRSDIEAQYRLIMQNVVQWDDKEVRSNDRQRVYQ